MITLIWSCKYSSAKCEFKKYVILMSEKNWPPSNEEFKNKVHWENFNI
jgi:hypothetical protein